MTREAKITRLEIVNSFLEKNKDKQLSVTKALTLTVDKLRVKRVHRMQLIDVILDNIDINFCQKGSTSGKTENIYRKLVLGGLTSVRFRIVEVKRDYIALIFTVLESNKAPREIFAVGLNYSRPSSPNSNYDEGMWFKVFQAATPNSEQQNVSFVPEQLAKCL